MQTDIVGLIVGVAGILIGIIVSYCFYRKSLRLKEPYWAIRSNNLIQGYRTKIDFLKVFFKDEDVENLTISRVLFWNDGADTIDKQDLNTANPLQIVGLNNSRILDVKVLASNNSSSQFKVSLEENECVYVDFDYLDENQGAVIQIVHTGKSSRDIEVVGDIKGVKELRNKLSAPRWIQISAKIKSKSKIPNKIVAIISALFGLAYIAMGLVTIFAPSLDPHIIPNATQSINSDQARIISMVVFFIFSGCLMTTMGMWLWRRLGMAPKGLEVFNDELLSP